MSITKQINSHAFSPIAAISILKIDNKPPHFVKFEEEKSSPYTNREEYIWDKRTSTLAYMYVYGTLVRILFWQITIKQTWGYYKFLTIQFHRQKYNLNNDFLSFVKRNFAKYIFEKYTLTRGWKNW